MTQVSKSNPNTSFSFYRNGSEQAGKPPNLPKISEAQLESETLTVQQFIDERIKREDWRHEFMMRGNMACGVTSTGVDAVLEDEKRPLTATEMFKEIFLRVKVEKQKMRVRFKVTANKGGWAKGEVFEIGGFTSFHFSIYRE